MFGCLKSDLETTDKNSNYSLNYLDPNQNPNGYPNDPYRILAITPSPDNWNIIVQYSGGCKDHHFFTWWDGNVEKNASQFYLFHNANDDACEAMVRDTITIDMTEVMSIAIDSLTITAINASNNKGVELKPELRHLVQGLDCYQSVSLLGTTCGQGIWDNQWLSLKHEIAGIDNIWLQPVRSGDNVELTKPETGKYKIGITALFGFEYESTDVNCQSLPEGEILPVAITCMEKD